ncbi:glycosyltransferase [Lactiplantibacillus plantarum]|uniref:glycosyltransferase n=1 Tax=Lactiplantibacillus plantarum TaxID=1590 RepID=UPI001BADF8E4|nr:glycosyltransferase [Lactiplantibacillus plantarum]MBS0937698.1 glycosyltransferase [Lactiplantibacillus plantarum]MBS0945777.1 glycosyltransferase [Lactiplantibacillus plantarum]
MNYLVGESVYTFNSGIEFSQFQRLKAFNESGYDTKLLTRNYSRFLARDVKTHAINPDDVINMYDYFQGTVGIERKEQSLRNLETLPLDYYHVVGMNNNHSHVLLDGKVVEDINVMPATIGLIADTKYNDSIGNVSMREYWDWRGFLSMTETYHPSGEVSHRQYFNLKGVPVLEEVYMNFSGKVQPTMWKLLNYKNRDYHFDSENELFTFFLNEINNQQQGLFISDRRNLDACVLNIINPKARYAYVHNVPFINPKHPTKSDLAPDYNDVFEEKSEEMPHFDKVIFPTQDLAKDIQDRYPEHVRRFVSAPDCYYPIQGKVRNLSNKKQLVYVGRLSEDKNIEDLIETFKLVSDKRTDVNLLLQGYFSSEEYSEKINKLIEQNDLKELVKINTYDPVVKHVYDEATLFINTSKVEGFGMNMLESMSYGLPVVSYSDIYSKKNLLRGNINSMSVKNKSASVLANQINEVLNNESLYNRLSQGAIDTTEDNSEDLYIKAWSSLM